MVTGVDEPIYKRKQMHTVPRMLKRIFTIATGAVIGTCLALLISGRIFPGGEVSRSSDYVREVMQLVNQNYVEAKDVNYDKLTRSAIHGLVESLDPHSEFMEARDYGTLEEELSGNFGGIGVQVEMRKEKVLVITPMAGSPGDKAGVMRGDEIVGVDGKDFDPGVDLDDVVTRLRGKPGTKVTVDFFRPSTQKRLTLALVREVITTESIRDVKLLPDDIGYLQLTEFSDKTGEDFANAVNGLLDKGAQSLVIDMRNNPGGLLDAAFDVAEPFFKKGELIVYTQGRRAADREEYRARSSEEPLSLPVAILINAGSASAAEVVTGALKDTHRAVVVGERSFGKGSVQSLFKLRNGEGVRLTTARYYTPGGVSIHEKGITPHVEVVMTAEEDAKLRVQRARTDVSDAKEFKERFDFTPIQDRQLEAALEVLRGIRIFEQRGGKST